MNVEIGSLYAVSDDSTYDANHFMVSVEGKGWKFYNIHSTVLMVIDKNVQVSSERSNELINVRVLLSDGLIGVYWNPGRLYLVEKSLDNPSHVVE